MHVGSNSSTPYSFYLNPDAGTYHFDTDFDVEFTVYFALDSSWFPLHPQLSDELYTFGFWSSSSGKYDPRIACTIVKIIEGHFESHRNSILTFICDDDDEKQGNRRRKFNGWYVLERHTDILKLDKDVYFEGKTKHTSILMHIENCFFEIVKDAYLNADPDITWKILD